MKQVMIDEDYSCGNGRNNRPNLGWNSKDERKKKIWASKKKGGKKVTGWFVGSSVTVEAVPELVVFLFGWAWAGLGLCEGTEDLGRSDVGSWWKTPVLTLPLCVPWVGTYN